MHGINKGFESISACLTFHRTCRLHWPLSAVKIKDRVAIITVRFNLQKTKDLEFRKENYSKAFNRFSVFVKWITARSFIQLPLHYYPDIYYSSKKNSTNKFPIITFSKTSVPLRLCTTFIFDNHAFCNLSSPSRLAHKQLIVENIKKLLQASSWRLL